MSKLGEHDDAVASIAARVCTFSQDKRPFRIYHGSTNSTRESLRRRDNTIDTSMLHHVIRVDRVKKTALVEPNVAMDQLVAAAYEHMLVPLVVMEFPGITVGGGFSGTSGESSSFRYGPFDATVNWIEIVLPSGKVAKASRMPSEDSKTDLFWAAASAFGTLGVVTLLEVQLRDAKPYVQLTYSLHDVSGVTPKMQQDSADQSVGYVDGIIFSRDSAVACVGKLADAPTPGAHVQRFLRATDPWFYVHARRMEKRLRKGPVTSVTEYVPLVDYLFRWDRGGFWLAAESFRYFLVPFNRITRFLLDFLLHTRTMYKALHHSGLTSYFIVQDVGVPFDRVDEFTDWLDVTLNIYPLWLCPLRLARDTPDAAHGLHSDFGRLPHDEPTLDRGGLMNFGVWGPAPRDRHEFVRQNRVLEKKVSDLGGKKWLYAHAYYTEDEFWSHYDRASYDAVRAKYGADWMLSVYDKVKVDVDAEDQELKGWIPWLLFVFWSIWPLRGLYGVFRTILGPLIGGEYLLRRNVSREREKTD
jgi:delta24-sterol reductase